LSEKYLGVPEPTKAELTTTSLRKYMPFVKAWGGWDSHFQPLLKAMKSIADKYNVSIANVAWYVNIQSNHFLTNYFNAIHTTIHTI
jgi:hypothetical protein